jgi:eukaryotic-like serine/threonine-protein kinase
MSIQVPLVEQGTPGGALERRRVQEEVRGRLFAGRGRPVRIGRFVVLRRLGSGGMGVVYAARDDELERDIAVKLLQPTHDDEGSRQRLLQEARAMAKLSHPNVVAVHEVGEHEGQVFVAMELVRGETLRAWAQAQPRSWRQVLAVMLQVARGLAAAHEAGIVHRDVKPENALVAQTRSGVRVSLVDFLPHSAGAAGSADSAEAPRLRLGDDLVVTKTGALIGTPAYMAPELWEGRAADARSDQFAFCVTLWEALYRERPQVGETGARSDSNAAPITLDDRGPSQRGTTVPGWLRRVVERGLSESPEQRWPSMDALLGALERGQTQARLRRGLGVAALLGLGVATFVGVQELERRRAIATCERAGESIAEVWNEDAREKLREALIGTGVNHAEVTAQKVMPWLDDHAQAWKTARTDACLDTNVHGTWDEELHERAKWCLDERRMELDALVEELSRGMPEGVEKAVQAAAGLERIEPCRERDLLLRTPTPPPEEREEVRTVRAELSRAAALQRTGAYEAGLQVARDALERAEALGWPPLTAAARLWVGRLLEKTGAFAEAEEALENAYFDAAQAGAVEVATDAAEMLAYVVGDLLARHAEGLRWVRLAEVGLASLPDVAGMREASRLAQLAGIRWEMGMYAEAKELGEQALAIREKALGPDHPDVARSLNNLAGSHWSMGAFEEARALYERALAIHERALGPDHPLVAGTLNNLAGVHSATGSYQGAKELLERALAIRERALGPEHLEVAASLSNLALLHQRVGSREEAKKLHERALGIMEKALGPNHPDVARGLVLLADFHQTYDEAMALHERALVILEKALGPDHPNVARTLSSLAQLHGTKGKYTEAKRLHERALAIYEKALGPDHPDMASSLHSLADVHQATGTYEEAKGLYERALAIREKELGSDHPDVAMNLNNLANIHGAMGTYEEAKGLYERALAITEKAVGPDHPDVATSLSNLARVHRSMGMYDGAKELCERALAITEKAVGPDHPAVGPTLIAFADVHHAMGAYGEAAGMYERAVAILEKAVGPDHPFVAYALVGLAGVALEQGRVAHATAFAERAVNVRENGDVPAEKLACARFALARAMLRAGNRSHALALAEAARDGWSEAGRDEQTCADAESWLARRRRE